MGNGQWELEDNPGHGLYLGYDRHMLFVDTITID